MREFNRTVGTLVLHQDVVFRDDTQATASWHTDYAVPAGEYELTGEFYVTRDGRQVLDHVFGRLPGTVVADYKPSSWCGVPFGNTDPQGGDTGKEGNFRVRAYGFSLARLVAEGGSWHRLRFGGVELPAHLEDRVLGTAEVRLDDDLELKMQVGADYDGSPVSRYSVEVVEYAAS